MTPEQYVSQYGHSYTHAIVEIGDGGYHVFLVDKSHEESIDDPEIKDSKTFVGVFESPDAAERFAAKMSAGIRRARER